MPVNSPSNGGGRYPAKTREALRNAFSGSMPYQNSAAPAAPPPPVAPPPVAVPGQRGMQAGNALQSLFDGTTGSRASGGVPPVAPSLPPKPARFGGGMQLPSDGRSPVPLPPQPVVSLPPPTAEGVNTRVFSPDIAPPAISFDPKPQPTPAEVWDKAAASRPAPPQPVQGPAPLVASARPDFPELSGFAAPSGQAMTGQQPNTPPPILGPAPPPGLADRGLGAVRQLQEEGTLGNRIGQDPQMNQPIAADLRGPAPQAGVSGAADFYRDNGRLMTNEQAAANYRNAPAGMKYQPNTTRGGAPVPTEKEFADSQKRSNERIARQASIARQGNFREDKLSEINRVPSSGGIAPGGYAKDQAEFDQRMKSENPGGAFGGTLPVKGADGRVTFADGPMKRFEIPISDTFKKDATGKIEKKGGYSEADLKVQADAKATFDARRGGTKQRQEDYQQRVEDNRSARQQNTQFRAERKADSRAVRQNGLSFGERLAASDPRADASRRVGEAQVAAAASRDRTSDQYRRDALAEQGRQADERNKTAAQAARDRISAESIKTTGVDPFAPKGSAATDQTPASEAPTAAELRNQPKDVVDEALAKVPPATRARIERELKQPSNFQNVMESPFADFSADTIYGQGAYALSQGFGFNRPPPPLQAKRPNMNDLTDQPGDNPAQKAARESLRRSRRGK